MCGIVTPPQAPASRGARGLAHRLLAGDPSLQPAPRLAAPTLAAPPLAGDGPPEPSNPTKLAEAHAMARRREHPLHAALMNPIHPDHRHAVATYEALFREAYAPVGPGPKPAARPGEGAKPGAGERMRPPSAPTDDDVGSARRQRPEPGRDPAPIRLAQDQATSDTDAGDDLTDAERMIARDAERGAEDKAAAQAAIEYMPRTYRHGLPPKTYVLTDKTYATMVSTILTLPNLSPTIRYVFMRLLSYEGTPHDSGGGSKGGISKQAWENAKKIIPPLAEGRGTRYAGYPQRRRSHDRGYLRRHASLCDIGIRRRWLCPVRQDRESRARVSTLRSAVSIRFR
jgi:hypothetical protein